MLSVLGGVPCLISSVLGVPSVVLGGFLSVLGGVLSVAGLLQIVKANYLEMLHAKLEVPRSNIMALKELTVTLQNSAPPHSTPYPSSCESATYKAGLWPCIQQGIHL